MKMRGFIALSILSTALFITSSCKDNSESDKQKETVSAEDKTMPEGFLVQGKIENGKGKVIRLVKATPNGGQVVATDTADREGNFELKGFSREKFFGIFNYDDSKKVFMVIDTADRIQLQIPAVHDAYTLEGSPESEKLRQLHHVEVASGESILALRKEYAAVNPDNRVEQEAIQERFADTVEHYNDLMVKQIEKSESILIPIFFYLNQQSLPYSEELKKELYTRAKEQNAQGAMVNTYVRLYESEMATAPGQPAPEISLQDSTGKTVSLSDYRGKVVLIDFWASWCGPCRQENPNVVRMYQRFKDHGFEIFGVSLDQERGKWVQAIQQDNIHWVHVSDLRGWQSSAAKLYAVSSIPSTFLVDREGKIIARGLRGEELEEKLDEVLN